MIAFIKEAITEKLMWINEEKEALDSKIEHYERELAAMRKTQAEYNTKIEYTVNFLKEFTNVKRAQPKTGQKRSGTLARDNKGANKRNSIAEPKAEKRP